ncbi:MAG: lamin tail domain-containing protein, partial [Nanoarchaeota archaeon]|nr:lamin tail domain-containing protein [Nanoarchaeota archaeon]
EVIILKKRLFILVAIAILLVQQISGAILIKEVLYDPLNTENGGEAVLLYNDGDTNIEVSGWKIATKASQNDATLPPNTHLSAGGYLLIADSGFSLNKDNSSWPNPDYEEPMTIANSNAGVSLMNGSMAVDTVGWGDPLLIGEDFYEGTPHDGVFEGQSLRRSSNLDTDNNSFDFYATTPVFYNSLNGSVNSSDDPLEIIIDVFVNITNNDPVIRSIEILADDNITKEGVQIDPVTGSTRYFEVSLEAYDLDNSSEIESATITVDEKEFSMAVFSSNETHVLFKTNVSMGYYEEAKWYNLTATITSIYGQDFADSTEFEYTGLAAISATTSLGFEIAPGNVSTKTVTVSNLGNQYVQLKVKGTDLSSGNNVIPLDDIEYSLDGFATSNTLTGSYTTVEPVLNPGNGSVQDIDFRISATENQIPGSYSGQFFIAGDII